MNIAVIHAMKHSPVHNYVIPGLTSWLIGAPPSKEHGCVRLFTMEREHEEPIIPHSHRFDFTCFVLRGSVNNHVWIEVPHAQDSDIYQISEVSYEGEFGKHERRKLRVGSFKRIKHTYIQENTYSMQAEEFHSIYFSKGTMVLFLEGPSRLETSQVLEPVVGGEVIPLFRTDPWMFRR